MTPDQRAVIQAAVEDLTPVAKRGACWPHNSDAARIGVRLGDLRRARAARDALAKLLEDGDG